jgi:hypothetical protein
MSEFSLPVLGFDHPRPRAIFWQDGTPCGILNLAVDPEASARLDAGRARKEQIQQSDNVVVLDDFRSR